jgi:hypothetical protein
MTLRPRTRSLLPLVFGLTLPLAGCFGSSNDKGDNPVRAPLFTPKPSTVQDANTAGERKAPLSVPEPPAGAPANIPAPEPK